MKLANRLSSQENKSFGMYEAAAKLQQTGVDVIHLEVGRPSSDTPVHIKEAAKTALDNGIVHYGELQGTSALREALAKRYRENNNLDVKADEILITNGVTQSAFAALMATVNEGDEVIILDPYYPQHIPKVELLGAKAVLVSLDKKKQFELDADAIEKAITKRTRMVILINPGNPIGKVYSREELEALSRICVKHDLFVLSDEVYELNTFDDAEHISIATLPDMWERTFTVNGFTKAYAMDGWRMGFTVAPAELIQAMMKITLNETTHPCIFAQEGAIAAVKGPQECLHEMVKADQDRRDLLVKRLNAIPGIKCPVPQATIYAFPDVSSFGLSSDELSVAILKDTNVAVESGSFYGANGEGHLRICFGSEPYDRLQEAINRIEQFFSKL